MVKLEISDLVVFEAVLGHLFWTPMATHLSARFKKSNEDEMQHKGVKQPMK